jgi:epoxyqueuosine reductase QueG
MEEGFMKRAEKSAQLKDLAHRNGATVFGVAEADGLLEAFPLLSDTVRRGMRRAISIGIRLSDRILDEIVDGPTHLYYFHYRRLNLTLDHIALLLTNEIQDQGFDAVPVPASQTIDWKGQRGLLSHKLVGQRAGHGWIGRNNLLVHPVYGAALRYCTILTDMPVAADRPDSGDCGDCRRCMATCPAGAISESRKTFDRESCYGMLQNFSKTRNIRHHICGICVRACRFHRDPSRITVNQ